MLIDWFTVFAQIINFLILVLLLKRFLYKPILAAMDSRQQQIDSNLHFAEEQKRLAEQERADLINRSEQLESGKAEQLKRATEEAETLRKKLIERARIEIADQRSSWTDSLERDKDAICTALTRRAQDEMIVTLRSALKDMAGAELEEEMATTFVRCLREMDSSEKSALKLQLTNSNPPVIIKSCFEMSSTVRSDVETAVRNELGITCPVDFQQAPNLICGVELAAGGHKVSWTMAQYLAALHDNLETALAEQKPNDMGRTDEES